MRDKVKRFISILMTALMLVNLMPVGALADGITSGGYQQATVANGNQTVYLYVKVTGNLNGLNLNKSGWCTVGKVTGLNMTDPQTYAWWYGSSNHVSSVSGISASSVGTGNEGNLTRYEKNQSIDLSKVTWSSGTSYGFLPVSTGADDYVGAGWTWHLDGYIDIAQVKASYKIRYVDQDTGKVLKIAASGTDDPGVWIDHTAPKTLEGGYEIVGDTDRTFKLEQIDNTFDIYYRRPYGYTVEYYYDDVKDKDATVIGESQMCGTEINAYTPKLKDGYELDETKTTKLPLTIGTDESKNVIKVYYKKIGYTVTYEPGEYGTFKTQKHDAKHGDATPAFDGETTGKPGWTFDGWEPEVADTVTENATYTAVFVPDEKQTATVLCTIDEKQIGYGTVYPSIYQTILQATGKLDIEGGGSVSGSTATAKPGYKFAGWYKATGEDTYEWVTGDPELTSELAESTLNRDKETGLYQNTVFEARFEPDAGANVPVTYKAENGTLKGTTSQEAQVVTGEGLTDVTAATPNTGYKFDGWYVVDKNGDEHLISGLDPAEKLDAKTAKENLNKDGNLYAATTFIARFVPDTKQNVEVIYTTDGNGDLDNSHYMVKQHVQIVTGEVVRENGSVIGPKLTTVRANAPSEGYEFDHWVKVIGENNLQRINGAKFELEDAQARPLLNKAADGLYQKTEFKAIFKPRTDLSYTVNYYWNGNHQNPIKSESGTATYGQIVNPKTDVSGYTLMPGKETSLTIGTGENVLNLYYYKNVKLIANSDEKTYDGKPKSVADYTCEVAKVHEDGTVEYVSWTGEPLTFEFVGAFGSGTDAGDYDVTFKEGSVGENNGLYYVKKVQPGTLTIKPALIKLRAPSASKTYDRTPLKAEDYGYGYEGNTDLANDFKSISVDGSQTMVGSSASSVTYELKQGKIPNNYNIQCIPGTLTITPVMDEVLVKIKGNTANVTYDGKLHSVEGYAVDSISNSLYTANDFTYNGVAKAEGTDAATYPMNLAETQFKNTNTNFKNVRFEVVTDGSLTISKRPVTLTSADLTKVYDGTVLTNGDTPVTVGGDGFADGEGATYDFTGSQTDVGKSANTFTYKANEKTKLTNYAITTEYGTLEVTPVTDKVTVTIKGGKSSVTYNGEEHTVSGYKVSDISNPLYTANDFSFSGTAEAKGKNAGTYKMGLKAADFANTSNNFTNVEFVVADGQLEITKRPVMLTSANLTKVYDGTALTNGDTPVKEEFGTEDAFPEGEGVTYTFKGSQTNAGSSKNTFTYAWNEGTNKDNYTIYQVEGDLVVTPIDGIKVTITGHKDTQTYDGKEHSVFGFDAEPSNALYNPKEDMQFNGTDVDMTAKGTDAGTYPMKLTAEDFTNKSNNFTNVTFVVTDGYVKITPRVVTLTSETASKTYDGTALEKPVVTAGGDGFVEDQVKEIKATGSVTNAGSVANTITFTPDKETFKESNYAITKNEGTLTIAKRSVLLTSQSATKTYDGSALTRPAVTITGDGFVPGELAKVEATGSITNVGSTPNAIQYTTTGAFNPANYSIALSVGTLTVTAKPEPEPRRTFNLTVNYVYQNGKRAAASYNRGGLKNGETFDITSPVIAGYTASETVVSGTIDNRDIKVTVIYTADGVNLDDYGVPLGLGNITMNVGDCFE